MINLNNLLTILRKSTAILVSGTILTSSVSAMKPSDALKSSGRRSSLRPIGEVSSDAAPISSLQDLATLSTYYTCIHDGPEHDCLLLFEQSIPLRFLENFYNIFRGYISFEDISRIKRNVLKDVIRDLIEYIRQYEFNGGFKSVSEILFLTFECIVRTSGVIGDFESMGLDISKFKKETISFEELKEVLITRLECLLEAWEHRYKFW